MKNNHLRSPMSKEEFLAKLAATPQTHGRVGTPEPRIGEKMPDGTIYGGISPGTKKPMYVASADAPLTMTFNDAQTYARRLDAHGHHDWRIPTKDELNMLFNNRAAIGGFNVRGSLLGGWYRSASSTSECNAWEQRFSDGYQGNGDKDNRSVVRCVR